MNFSPQSALEGPGEEHHSRATSHDPQPGRVTCQSRSPQLPEDTQESAADHQTLYEPVPIPVVARTGQTRSSLSGRRQKGLQGSSTPLASCFQMQLLLQTKPLQAQHPMRTAKRWRPESPLGSLSTGTASWRSAERLSGVGLLSIPSYSLAAY